jgi:DNA-binding protein H-NS
MTSNLASYSLPQLKQLSARVAKEIVKQEAAVKAATLKKLERLAREQGLTLNEVLSVVATAATRKAPAAKVAPASKPALPPKYRHPSKSDLAWSGRGRKPQWVDAWLANGGALDALATAAEKFAKKQERQASLLRQSTAGSISTAIADAEPPAAVNAGA